MLAWSDKDISLLNEVFRNLNSFHESFNLLNFFIQPHIMHINNMQSKAISNSAYKLHSHKAFEYSIVIEGSMIYTFEDRVIEVPAGNTVIIPPDVSHYWSATETSTVFSFMLFISCHGDGSREKFNMLKKSINRLDYTIKKSTSMEFNLEMIIKEAQNQKNGFDEKIQCITRSIYIEIFRRLLPPQNTSCRSLQIPPKRGDISASVVDLVRFYVQDNISKNIKIKDVSSSIGISINHLNRIFKKNHGDTIHQYIITRRIDNAANLLQSTDRPVKDIATSVGYEDVDYFCRVFKKNKGITPSQFRKNL
jgi:AraC family L-rhamnose operon transcriptional activator RhaR